MQRHLSGAFLALGFILLLSALGGYVVLGVLPSWGRVVLGAGAALVAASLAVGWRTLVAVLTSARFQRGTASTVLTVGVIGILVLVNILGGRYHWRTDMTRAGEFTLSDQTVEVLGALESDIDITAFFTRDSAMRGDVSSLLREYEIKSPRIRVEFVDPEQHPSRAQEYGITRSGTIVMESGGQRHDVTPLSLYQFGQTPDEIQFRGEQALTRAIMELTMQVGANIYFLTGHGGPSIHDRLQGIRAYLTGEGYSVREINLAREGSLPEDADLVILPGPKRDLDQRERQELQSFLEQEGRLLVFLASVAQTSPQPNLKELLASVGIGINDDVVVDPTRSYFMDPLSPVPRYEDHPITRKLIDQQLAIVFPHARSLEILMEEFDDWTVRRVLASSRDAWGSLSWQQGIDRKEGDIAGPLNLGLLVSRPLDEEEKEEASQDPMMSMLLQDRHERGLALVLGNAEFITDDLLGFQGNLDFFMSSVDWLLGEKQLMTIRPKMPAFVRVFLTGQDVRIIFYGTVVVVPLLVLVAGGFVWYRRRRL